MTLRDWFAGQALMGLCTTIRLELSDEWHRERAKKAYRQADAMLATRMKGLDDE